MAIHDWTRVDAGIFHAFHHDWITDLSRALNRGVLPEDYYALPEQIAGRLGPDVLTLQRPTEAGGGEPHEPAGGVALAESPPKVSISVRSDASRYAARAKAVAIRHVSNHRVVAMAEIVSPGNKSSRTALNSFVRKAQDALAAGIHLLIVDLFPASSRDPQGIHAAIWDEVGGEGFSLPLEKSMTCVSYIGVPGSEAFIEPIAVGDDLPDMPLFLTPEVYVNVPLNSTYASAWDSLPAYWRDVVAG